MFELQRLVLPSPEFGAPQELYVRVNPDVAIVRSDRQVLQFIAPGTATFDTFFNGLSVGRWKEFCDIPDLHLSVSGQGKFVISFYLMRMGHADRLLSQQELELAEAGTKSLVLPFWGELEDGIVHFTIAALGRGEISNTRYLTSAKPRHDVRLGVVITHFNRRKFVLPAIRRIHDHLLQDPLYAGKIELVVVDNSRSIEPGEAPGATLIPNQNLGGSGGFMRGLLHVEDSGTFTHCLFMDDDASCEMESIRRTFAILSFGKVPRLAVAGCILRDVEPWVLEDKVFYFDGHCRPIKRELDLREPEELVFAETHYTKSNFGGWWHFAFALKDVKHYAFPFFVKGDDIAFGMMNSFNICSMNGIGSWAEEFFLKSSKISHYLDARCLAFLRICLAGWRPRRIASEMVMHFMATLYTYNYESAYAVSLALEHLQTGSPYWKDNLDFAAIRGELNALGNAEQTHPIHRQNYALVYAPKKVAFWRHWLMELTMGGHLLPSSFFHKAQLIFQDKGFHGQAAQTFGFERIFYEYEPLRVGYVAEINRRKFFHLYFRFWLRLAKFLSRFQAISAAQRQALAEFTQRSFWQQVYNLPQKDAKQPDALAGELKSRP